MNRQWIWFAVPVCAIALGVAAQPAAGDDALAADLPSGTVAFSVRADGTCPPGMQVANETIGRLLIGVNDGNLVGKSVGLPLSNEEDRTHVHPFAAEVELPYKSISATDGSNKQGAAADTYKSSGNSDASPSGLPFIQLVACVKP